MFYDGDLQCFGDPIATMNMAQWEHLPCKGFPIIFHSLEGSNLREGNSPSWFNPEEAQQVVEYAKKLLFDTRPALQQDEIGVITPYARQAQKIRLALKAEGITEIKVGSVETFQGQERRCIIVSTVRSQQSQLAHDQKYNLGFVSNEKRFNVAITRAKTLLIVIGCAKVLATDRNNWAPFLTYCHKNGGWAGDEFNQEELGIEEDDSVPDVDDGWDLLMGAPSHKAEQEAFGFVGQEE